MYIHVSVLLQVHVRTCISTIIMNYNNYYSVNEVVLVSASTILMSAGQAMITDQTGTLCMALE